MTTICLQNSIAIVESNGLKKIGQHLSRVLPKGHGLIITDSNVGPIYANSASKILKLWGFSNSIITIPAGEKSKGWSTFTKVAETVADSDKPFTFIAGLGGGVVGDFSGFLASIYRRGVPHVQLPTSLMAQVDSSIGGKNGLNAIAAKNIYGTVCQPILTLTDPLTLQTLGEREFYSGFGEIIKQAILSQPKQLGILASLAPNIRDQDMEQIIARNIRIKMKCVQDDLLGTKGLRDKLNFGHTVGHAIEQVAGYGTYLHGEAISMGIVAALKASEQEGLPSSFTEEVIKLLELYKLPTSIPKNLSASRLINAITKDKKFQNNIRFVLLKEPGKAYISETVTYQGIATAIEQTR